MTPNQVVAWNLARARQLRGWTQSQARTLDLSRLMVLHPAPPFGHDGKPTRLSTSDAKRFGTEVALLVDLVFGTEQNQPLVAQRLHELITVLGASGLTRAHKRRTRNR